MKKVLTIAMLGASTFALSTAAIADGEKMDGAYAGASLGWITGKSEVKTKTNNAVLGSLSGQKGDLGSSGLAGGVHIGYSKQFENNFVGMIEALVSLTGEKGKFANNWIKYEGKESYGINLKAGYSLNGFIPYFLVGWANQKYTLKEVGGQSASKRLNGITFGAGCVKFLTDNILLGAEVKFPIFKDLKAPSNSTTLEKITPRKTDLVLTLSYKW